MTTASSNVKPAAGRRFTVIQWAGLASAIIAFATPVALYLTGHSLTGLSYAGHITLAVFLMAICLWVTEAVPIYATSVLVILLFVALLSSDGPVYQLKVPEIVNPSAGQGPGRMLLPPSVLALQPKDASVSPGASATIYEFISKTGRIKPHTARVESLSESGVSLQCAAFFDSAGKLNKNAKIVKDASDASVAFRLDNPPQTPSYFYSNFAHTMIILFLGGFVMASASVRYKLDHNLTRLVLHAVGTKPSRILAGLMGITALLSAFMSNTATTAMMMTMILPIIARLDEDDPFRISVTLSIPFAANIGGIATPVGTPPNAIVIGALRDQAGINIAFSDWVFLATPMTLVMLAVCWKLLMLLFPPKTDAFIMDTTGAFDRSRKAIILYVTFGVTILLWMTEKLHGIDSSVVACLPIAVLTLTKTVEKNDIRSMAWEVLWLVAGGFCLGATMKATGTDAWLIERVDWAAYPSAALVLFAGQIGRASCRERV